MKSAREVAEEIVDGVAFCCGGNDDPEPVHTQDCDLVNGITQALESRDKGLKSKRDLVLTIAHLNERIENHLATEARLIEINEGLKKRIAALREALLSCCTCVGHLKCGVHDALAEDDKAAGT